MPVIRTEAIVCTVRPHGEHGAIARVMTPDDGLQAGYVQGARSRTRRPVLMPGNRVSAELRSRAETQLASLTVELIESRAPYYGEPLTAAGLQWATLLTAQCLPEGQGFATLYRAFSALLDAIIAAPSARGWAEALVRYELLLLAELGFGLDLSQCIATGSTDDLAYVSPKSAAAVSAAAGDGYRDRLLVLPAFLVSDVRPDWEQLFAGLTLTGHFLERAFFTDYAAKHWAARAMLLDRLHRAQS